MHINIKNDEAHGMARELSRLTGENLTQAVTKAIAERLARERARILRDRQGLGRQLRALADECSKLPELDDRDPDAILYDQDGLPKRD